MGKRNRKPFVNTKPVAAQHDLPGERTIEYSSEGGGGLISFRLNPEGQLTVLLYRHDPTVQIDVSAADGDISPRVVGQPGKSISIDFKKEAPL